MLLLLGPEAPLKIRPLQKYFPRSASRQIAFLYLSYSPDRLNQMPLDRPILIPEVTPRQSLNFPSSLQPDAQDRHRQRKPQTIRPGTFGRQRLTQLIPVRIGRHRRPDSSSQVRPKSSAPVMPRQNSPCRVMREDAPAADAGTQHVVLPMKSWSSIRPGQTCQCAASTNGNEKTKTPPPRAGSPTRGAPPESPIRAKQGGLP